MVKMSDTAGKLTDTELSLKLFVVLTRTLQSIQKQTVEDIRRYGVNQTEFAVLVLLYNKGEQPIHKIGEKVLLASSSITSDVDLIDITEFKIRKDCVKDYHVSDIKSSD